MQVSSGVKGFKVKNEETEPCLQQLHNTASQQTVQRTAVKDTVFLTRSVCLHVQLCPDTNCAFQGLIWHESDEGRVQEKPKEVAVGMSNIKDTAEQLFFWDIQRRKHRQSVWSGLK